MIDNALTRNEQHHAFDLGEDEHDGEALEDEDALATAGAKPKSCAMTKLARALQPMCNSINGLSRSQVRKRILDH